MSRVSGQPAPPALSHNCSGHRRPPLGAFAGWFSPRRCRANGQTSTTRARALAGSRLNRARNSRSEAHAGDKPGPWHRRNAMATLVESETEGIPWAACLPAWVTERSLPAEVSKETITKDPQTLAFTEANSSRTRKATGASSNEELGCVGKDAWGPRPAAHVANPEKNTGGSCHEPS